MSLKDKASLIFKPSRYKSGTAYSFRGSDVTVSRSSVGTRVNEEGKIEEVAANVPRLNYDPTDLTKCPTLLMEKDTSNYVATSNIFTNWTTYQASVTANAAISPDGTQNAYKLVNSSGNSYHFINYSSSGANRTLSVFVKAAEYSVAGISSRSTNPFAVTYDLINETSTKTYDQNNVVQNHGIKNYGDGWYRIWVSVSAMVQMNIHCAPYGYSGSFNSNDADGDGVSGIYIWEAQIEDGLVPSSIIKTTGSTATRDDDTVTASSPINGARGSFYINMSSMHTTGYGTTVPSVAIYKTNTTTGAIGLLDNNTTNGEMRAGARINGSLYYYNTHFSAPNGFKMCFVWDSNDSDTKAYKNGVLWGTVGVSSTQTFSDGIVLNAATRENFFEYEEVAVYNERLSEAEAIALTSYDDYQELVDRNDLTWEDPTSTNNRLTALQEL